MNQDNRKGDEEFREFNEFQLDSFSEFTSTDVHNEDLISLNDIAFEEMEFESKYRSIAAVPSIQVSDYNLATREVPSTKALSVAQITLAPKQDEPKKIVALPSIEVLQSSSPSLSTTDKSTTRPSVLSVPAEPFYVAPSTHFVVPAGLNAGDVKDRVEAQLGSIPAGVSYEFFPSKCRWEGVYLVGSVRCKFEINVYKRNSGALVVEGNRLSGDSFAFVNIYKSIRNQFDSSDDSTGPQVLTILPTRRAPDAKAIQNSINAVLSMAKSGIGEAQLGASQILCNLASDNAMHASLLNSGCVSALLRLVDVDFQCCNQHAICALAELSSSHSCQEVLLRDASFLQTLLPLCSDGAYNSIEMRRECARLLANISCSSEGSAQQVVANAGREAVQDWLRSVDDLCDERLRVHADRARVSLASCT